MGGTASVLVRVYVALLVKVRFAKEMLVEHVLLGEDVPLPIAGMRSRQSTPTEVR